MGENTYRNAVESLDDERFNRLDLLFLDVDRALTELYDEHPLSYNWVESGDVKDYLEEQQVLFRRRYVDAAMDALSEIGALPEGTGGKYNMQHYCEETDAGLVQKAIRYRKNGDPEDGVPSALEEFQMLDWEQVEE